MPALNSPADRSLKRDNLVPLFEVALILIPVVTIIWVMPLVISEKARRQQIDFWLIIVTLLIGLGSNLYRREGFAAIGLRLDNLTDAIRELFGFTLVASAVILAIGLSFDSVNLGRRFIQQLEILFFWGLLQQYGVQSIINRRLQITWNSSSRSAWITAAIFAALHLPNPTLTIATLIGGYFWASTFQRHPNLIAISLTHSLLSALLANSFPKELLPNMKVGWGYF